MKKNIAFFIIIISLITFVITLAGFTEKKTDTKVFVDNKTSMIKMYIEMYTKGGYKVQNITSQAVTAVCSQGSSCLTKGDIILIMTKD